VTVASIARSSFFRERSSNKPDICGVKTWSGHPYNAQNNINGIDGDRNGDGGLDVAEPAIRELHAAYLQKVLDTTHEFDNVLYEVVNEGGDKD
jgi:hypothetical protein